MSQNVAEGGATVGGAILCSDSYVGKVSHPDSSRLCSLMTDTIDLDEGHPGEGRGVGEGVDFKEVLFLEGPTHADPRVQREAGGTVACTAGGIRIPHRVLKRGKGRGDDGVLIGARRESSCVLIHVEQHCRTVGGGNARVGHGPVFHDAMVIVAGTVVAGSIIK